ncbi:hypothetical protein PROPEN_00015 [Proteus penneri ATCC 35198]|nr:hypothetical protein PROPEN_00015 [Proteus penneri ATCC 35198]
MKKKNFLPPRVGKAIIFSTAKLLNFLKKTPLIGFNNIEKRKSNNRDDQY